MTFVIMGLGSRITKLEETTEAMIYSYNQNFAIFEQEISSLHQQVDALTPAPEDSTEEATSEDTTEESTDETTETTTEEGDTAE